MCADGVPGKASAIDKKQNWCVLMCADTLRCVKETIFKERHDVVQQNAVGKQTPGFG